GRSRCRLWRPPGSWPRRRGRWGRRTSAASSTRTSSRRTSWSARTAGRASSTSAWHAEDKIKQADRDRAKRKTILQQLGAAEAGGARIRKFRDEAARARRDGKRLVFSLLGCPDGAVFCKYLDRAFSTGPDRSRQGVKWLRAASFLLTPPAA